MDHEDEFIYIFFTHVSQLCFDKAKEHVVSGFPIRICYNINIVYIFEGKRTRDV